MVNSRVIIACDFDNEAVLNQFLYKFGKQRLFLKLGMELIYSCGFDLINRLKNQGHDIFLDLKLHDITTTIIKTLKVLKKYPITMLTVHLIVGNSTLQQIKEKNIKILGVSVLTNLNDDDWQQMLDNNDITVNKIVAKLTSLAASHQLAGVVCSAWESAIIKKTYPQLLTICPGIQSDSLNNDQKRVATPQQAKTMLVDYIVVGRAITKQKNPVLAYQEIKKQFEGENCDK